MCRQSPALLRALGLLLACLAAILPSASASPSTPAEASAAAPALRQRTLLDADWLFHLGDFPAHQPVSPGYDDSQWQPVNLPHDYVLEGAYAFSRSHAVRGHAYLPCHPAWYRKHFFLPASAQGKILRLDFDGVFRDSQVWLNGQFLGRHPGGYTPFSYDVTGIAEPGAENIITVRVDPRQFEGWWYEGGGIYRHVYLTALAPLHVAQYGAYVVATVPGGDQGADARAGLAIRTTVENSRPLPANSEIVSDIIAPDGHWLQTLNTNQIVPANGRSDAIQQTVIDHPQLWSLQSPALYQLRTTILQDGVPVDATATTFGIRTIRFDANRGFFLNGRRVEIQGVANHQDFAGVGIAVPDSLQAWRVEQFKKMGCNAWRTAHNPPSPALLDACDRLGMLVMDENRHLGDAYTPKTHHGDTGRNLTDLAAMILRDRNHPSIIMWSMCNEEPLQGASEGRRLFTNMMRVVRLYDRTRPVTCAMVGGFFTNGIATVEDLVGINYNSRLYDAIHRRYPDKALFGSEDDNEKTIRGEYSGACSCYNLSDKNWLAVVNRPFMAGSFTWTGFDYKGEPNPRGWPDVSSSTGLLDACGFPKDKYFYFESCWSDQPMVHLLPESWNRPEQQGQPVRVLAFSNARQVELFLNGQSLGARTVPHDDYVAWQVPWRPGRLLAIASTGGQPVATDSVETTDVPFRIRLAPDRTTLLANAEDAVVVPVSIVDSSGRVVPDSVNRVAFQLAGPGQILGVGNGDPADHDPDKAAGRNAFHGHCIAVIEAGSRPGTLQLTATSPGLLPATVNFAVQ